MSFYTNNILEEAYQWLCQRRKDYSCHADVWQLRSNWDVERPKLLEALQREDYQMEAVTIYHLPDKTIGVWAAKDALVLKMMAIYLRKELDPILSARIFHLAGMEDYKRGTKAAIQEVYTALPQHQFVFRTDVKGYYASIQHQVLFDICQQYIEDPFLLKLIKQYLRHHIYDDGIYRSIQKGISLGCPLSPLMGALCLKPLDDAMEQTDLFYLRFMDDWVILAPTRWKLRAAIKTVNQCLEQLQFKKHPDKTYIGRIANGFDFLGFHFSVIAPDSNTANDLRAKPTQNQTTDRPKTPAILPQPTVNISTQSFQQYLFKITQLYEQNASFEHIGQYRRRWKTWVQSQTNLLAYNQLTPCWVMGL